jgi:hypothetical protein
MEAVVIWWGETQLETAQLMIQSLASSASVLVTGFVLQRLTSQGSCIDLVC